MKQSNFLCRGLEMVFKQNMSETIICNHAALINLKGKTNKWKHRGIQWASSTFSVAVKL